MSEPRLKALASHRGVKLGTLVAEFATPGIGHILKSAGCDFVFFDMEHSGFGLETVKSAIRYFEAADLPVMVRVPSQDYHFLARAMDMGAEGLIAPMVSTVEQAQHIINSMKYHPAGARGVALQIAHDRYRPGSVADKFEAANRRSVFICLIETADGVKNIDGDRGDWMGSIVCGSGISICRSRSAFPATSPIRPSPPRWLKSFPPPRSTTNRSAASCPASSRGTSSTHKASISFVIRATSGSCTTRWPTRSSKIRAGCK